MTNIPKRRCLGCMQMKPKSTLIRMVKSKDGEVIIDKNQKADGRGAYICKDISCLKTCQKKSRLNMAFKTKVDDKIYESLEKEI